MIVRSYEVDAQTPLALWSNAGGTVTPAALTSVAALLGVSIEQPQNGRFRMRAMLVDMSVPGLAPTTQYVAANPADGTLRLVDNASDPNGLWMFYDAGRGADRHGGWPVTIWNAPDASAAVPLAAVNGAGRLVSTTNPTDAYTWILSPSSLVLPPQGGAATTSAPAPNVGCILWLDASDNRYVSSDVYGRTQAAAGDTVQLWLDRSPAQNHATAVAAAVYYRGSAVNQRPALIGPLSYRFTRPLLPVGTDDSLGATLFIVCQSDATKANLSPLTLYMGQTTCWLPYSDGIVSEVLGSGTARLNVPLDATSKPFLYTVVANAATAQTTVYRNATAKVSGAYTPNTLSQFAAGLAFMHPHPQNHRYRYNGLLFEIMLFQYPLTETSRPRLSEMTSRLISKWAITP